MASTDSNESAGKQRHPAAVGMTAGNRDEVARSHVRLGMRDHRLDHVGQRDAVEGILSEIVSARERGRLEGDGFDVAMFHAEGYELADVGEIDFAGEGHRELQGNAQLTRDVDDHKTMQRVW